MFKKIIQKFKSARKAVQYDHFIQGYNHMAGVILRQEKAYYKKLNHILQILDKYSDYEKGMLAAIKDGEDFDLIIEDMIR